MAIIRMKPFYAIGMLDYKANLFKDLQKLDCVEINTRHAKLNVHDNDIENFKDKLTKIETAIEAVRKYGKVKKNIVNFKRVEPYDRLVEISKNSENLLQQVEYINSCYKQINSNDAEILNLTQEKTMLIPYVNFDYILANFDSEYTRCFLGVISSRITEDELKDLLEDDVYFEVIDKDKFKMTMFFIVLKDKYMQLRKVLTSLKFSDIGFSLEGSTAQERIDFCDGKIEELMKMNERLKLEVKDRQNLLLDLELFFDYMQIELDMQEKSNNIEGTKHIFIVEGYLNPDQEEDFEKVANRFDMYFQVYEPDETSPTDFKNNSIVTPVEGVTKTYSMPAISDVDPNPVMAFFYYAFFGIMFSDAGYGFLMAFFCAIFAFSKKVDSASRNRFKMFFWCGVSTTFWGLMFGSFFGDFIGVVSKTFFKSNFSFSPILIDTLNKPMELLGFSLIFGLLQVFVGVVVKFLSLVKARQFKEAFFKQFGWLLFLLGAGVFSIVIMFLGQEVLASFLKSFSVGLVAIGVASIILLSGYEEKGIMKLIKGLINFYGVTSYVGDVLSYCRLMALAIATGVVANVVNLLSSMLCVNIFGFLLFILVFIFGHAMNFGINALGAYVHTTRLQYVEFFSKFYEGGGRLFSPFGFKKTKYVEIKNPEIF